MADLPLDTRSDEEILAATLAEIKALKDVLAALQEAANALDGAKGESANRSGARNE